MEKKLNMTTNSCCVAGCGGRIKPLFCFPNPKVHSTRFREWVHAARNPRYKGLSALQIYRRGFICYKHFKPEDFQNPRKLLWFAVPTLNLPPDVEGKIWDPEALSSEPNFETCESELGTDYVAPTREGSPDRQLIDENELFQNFFCDYNAAPDPRMLLRGSIFKDLNIMDFLPNESDDNYVLIAEDDNTDSKNYFKSQNDALPTLNEYVHTQNSHDLCHSNVLLEHDATSENFLELDQNSVFPLRDKNENCNTVNQFESEQNSVFSLRDKNENCNTVNQFESEQNSVFSLRDRNENCNTVNQFESEQNSVVSWQDTNENCNSINQFESEQNSVFPLRDKNENCNTANQFESEVRPNLKKQPELSSNVGDTVFTDLLPNQEVPIQIDKPYFKSVKSFLQDCRRMTEVCRICFQSLEDNEVIKLYEESSDQGVGQLKHMLQLVLPDLDLEIYPNTVICVKCVELLVYSYRLKEKWLSTEEKLQKIIEKKKGVINRDADLVIIGKRVVTKVEVEGDHDYIGKPQCKEPPEPESPDELVPQLLQSLGVETDQKCVSQNVSIFYGNLDNNFFPTKQLEHKPVEQKVAKPPEKRPSMCHKCGLMYPNTAGLNRHLKTHNKLLSKREHTMCEICGKLCASVGSLKMHKITHLEKKCSFCDRVFQSSRQLYSHISSKHKRKDKRKIYQCHLCGKQSLHRNFLGLHLKTHNYANRNKVCHICNKKFLQMCHLKKHLNTHVKEKSLKCEFCGKFLKHRLSLEKHIKIWHLNQAQYYCEFCNKPYWKKCDLEKHRLRFHNEPFSERNNSAGFNEENCAVESILYKALTIEAGSEL